jgi:hypothetical protein
MLVGVAPCRYGQKNLHQGIKRKQASHRQGAIAHLESQQGSRHTRSGHGGMQTNVTAYQAS